LKKQLKDAYKENRDAFHTRSKRYPDHINYIAETVKMSRSVQRAHKKADER